MTQNISLDEIYTQKLQNLEIYGNKPIVNSKQIIELFEDSSINIITNFLKCDIKKIDSYSVELKFVCDSSSIMTNNIYIMDKFEATKVLVWIIKKWTINVLDVMQEQVLQCGPFLWNDCGIYKFREWFSIIGDVNQDEDEDDDIISTLAMVKNSMRNDCIKQWISTDIYSYSKELCSEAGEPNLYEFSVPTHNLNIKTSNLSDMPFDWDHHTITEKTMYNILNWVLCDWIIKNEKKTLSINCDNLGDEDYEDDSMKILKKIREYVDVFV